MDLPTNQTVNPLSYFMRQPKIYIKLPSEGRYWPEGSLQATETGEYPVYSMTAKDELLLQVPDALMNGQAVVDVIQNCMPNIKNAWNIPNTDVDIILIAIRLATYGEMLNTPINVTEDIEMEYRIDLRTVLDDLMSRVSWDPVVSISNELTVFVKPLTYKHITTSALGTFETQKIIQLANNDEINEDEKIKLFTESLNRLTNVTIGMVRDSIFKIDSTHGSTDDPIHIKEFLDNIDKTMFNTIQSHLEKMREQNSLKNIVINVTDEMKAQGITSDTIEVPLVFDPATFFA